MYAICGKLELAQHVFDHMEKRDVVCWNSLIFLQMCVRVTSMDDGEDQRWMMVKNAPEMAEEDEVPQSPKAWSDDVTLFSQSD